jgi:hypothetical protein
VIILNKQHVPPPNSGAYPWPIEPAKSVTPSPLSLIYAARQARERRDDDQPPPLEPLKFPDAPLYTSPEQCYAYRRNNRRFPAQRPMVMHLMRLRRLQRIDQCRTLAYEYQQLQKRYDQRVNKRGRASQSIVPSASPSPSPPPPSSQAQYSSGSTPRRTTTPAPSPPPMASRAPQTPQSTRASRSSPLASPTPYSSPLSSYTPVATRSTRGFLADSARNDNDYQQMMAAMAAEQARQIRIANSQAGLPDMILDEHEKRALVYIST